MRKTLAEAAPELCKEWSERNYPLRPENVSYGSNLKVWWAGKCGHEWQAVVKNRKNGAGCPVCASRKIILGINDLGTLHPELSEEWSDRNGNTHPTEYSSFSNRRVWWKCRTCGNEWIARIADRSKGHGCPYCSNYTFFEGMDDLETLHPEVASEWSPKNGLFHPSMASAKSRERVWWKCRNCGHEWQAVIYGRVNGASCPVCSNHVVEEGINDLATTDIDLSTEWNWKRNERTPYDVHRYMTQKYWWKCGTCGNEWKAGIYDRAVRGRGCPLCEARYKATLPQLVVLYYAGQKNLKVMFDDRSLTGIKIDSYIPEINLALEFGHITSGEGYETESVQKYLCQHAGVKLVRISQTRERDLFEEIRKAFSKVNIFLNDVSEKDLAIIRDRYNELIKMEREQDEKV